MQELRLLIVNLSSPIHAQCVNGTCQQLFSYIRQSFSSVNIKQVTEVASTLLESPAPHIILLQPAFGSNSRSALRTFKKCWPEVPALGVCCGKNQSFNALDRQILQGFDDFLFCPFQETDVEILLRRVLHLKSTNAWQRRTPDLVSITESFVGQNEMFLKTVGQISIFAKCDTTVVINGETGTGKELFARAIHFQSHRREMPFVAVNCGALPDQLVENELFGHTKGAFTDASLEQKGLLGEAEGGTLLLDEVDSLSPASQVKLLRFLQELEYRPLGSSKSLKANVRVLASTNAKLKHLVQEKLFREDLYYRLNILSASIPPLRERMEDIPLLVTHFLKKYEQDREKDISSEALQKLLNYHWPGNVRELENIIHRSVTLYDTRTIEANQIDLTLNSNSIHSYNNSFREAKSGLIKQFERGYLANLLAKHKGNVSQASKAAGKERRSFQRLLQKYGLDRTAFQKLN